MKGSDDVGGFWGVLVRKAKAILEDETMSREIEAPSISPPKANQVINSLSHPLFILLFASYYEL